MCRTVWFGRARGVCAYLETGTMSADKSLLPSTSSSSSRMRVGTCASCDRCWMLDLSGVVEALAMDMEVLDL